MVRFGEKSVLKLGVLALAALTAIAVAGCATVANNPPASQPAAKPTATQASASTSSTAQKCGVCAGKHMAPKVSGTAETVNGAQVVNVSLVNGFYSPNSFVVKAGVPVTAVFTGQAVGCLAHPTFTSLGKTADLTKGGTVSVDLGTLKPGTYVFTCGMGMQKSAIVAR